MPSDIATPDKHPAPSLVEALASTASPRADASTSASAAAPSPKKELFLREAGSHGLLAQTTELLARAEQLGFELVRGSYRDKADGYAMLARSVCEGVRQVWVSGIEGEERLPQSQLFYERNEFTPDPDWQESVPFLGDLDLRVREGDAPGQHLLHNRMSAMVSMLESMGDEMLARDAQAVRAHHLLTAREVLGEAVYASTSAAPSTEKSSYGPRGEQAALPLDFAIKGVSADASRVWVVAPVLAAWTDCVPVLRELAKAGNEALKLGSPAHQAHVFRNKVSNEVLLAVPAAAGFIDSLKLGQKPEQWGTRLNRAITAFVVEALSQMKLARPNLERAVRVSVEGGPALNYLQAEAAYKEAERKLAKVAKKVGLPETADAHSQRPQQESAKGSQAAGAPVPYPTHSPYPSTAQAQASAAREIVGIPSGPHFVSTASLVHEGKVLEQKSVSAKSAEAAKSLALSIAQEALRTGKTLGQLLEAPPVVKAAKTAKAQATEPKPRSRPRKGTEPSASGGASIG